MNIEITEPVSREKWLKALHVKGAADEMLTTRIDEAEKLLFAEAGPRAVYKIMDRRDLGTRGRSIEKHLEGCDKVALMGVTLGIGVDNLLRRIQVTDMSLAVIIDCGASVLVEQLCDSFEEYIKQHVAEKYLTSRFSPGYGDYPIEEQGKIIKYLDAVRQIGLNVTKDSLMIPRKSVTALIGLANHPVKGTLATCRECVLKDKCTLRREGKFCGD